MPIWARFDRQRMWDRLNANASGIKKYLMVRGAMWLCGCSYTQAALIYVQLCRVERIRITSAGNGQLLSEATKPTWSCWRQVIKFQLSAPLVGQVPRSGGGKVDNGLRWSRPNEQLHTSLAAAYGSSSDSGYNWARSRSGVGGQLFGQCN